MEGEKKKKERRRRKEKKGGKGSRNPGPSEFLGRVGFGPTWLWAELVLGRLGLGRVGFGPS